ncbi:hypothetical protein FNV43_RR15508 [Rhamnella rubrinervis]|uniref:HVA22-like protein n=1 Tax=Rhamnella rubrinervis TaxID=2594499 RepID=A0A8K0E6P1_9ROSA|nr:hypothetical protein FNV43_RR15508 [Rhamnella rubrinervis]
MLGDFITRLLIMLLGYAYPAFECYKVVEKNRVEIEELRFWCKYWILVAMISVTERIGDIFISWLPMYGEMKVAFYIYLWYPKTKGTGYVYETLLRPYMAKHETDIDRKLVEWKAKVWDLVVFHMQNWTQFGQSAFVHGLQYLASQSTRFQSNPSETSQKTDDQQQTQNGSFRAPNKLQGSQSLKNKKKGLPSPPPSPVKTMNRSISEIPTSKLRHVNSLNKTEQVHIEEASIEESDPDATSEGGPINEKLNQARLRLRRSKQLP